jgi:hypothetical protein
MNGNGAELVPGDSQLLEAKFVDASSTQLEPARQNRLFIPPKTHIPGVQKIRKGISHGQRMSM